MATSISINTLTNVNSFFTSTITSTTLTNNLLRASTMRSILESGSLGNIFANNSVPTTKLNGTIKDTQIQTKQVYGASFPSGKVQHINDRTITPINLTHGTLDWSANGVGVGKTAASSVSNGSTTFNLDVKDHARIDKSLTIGSSLYGGASSLILSGGGTSNDVARIEFINNNSTTTNGKRQYIKLNSAGNLVISDNDNSAIARFNQDNTIDVLKAINPQVTGSASGAVYRFYGASLQANTGLYYDNTNNAISFTRNGVVLCQFADSWGTLASSVVPVIRFYGHTATVDQYGNRIVNLGTGVYGDNSGTNYYLKATTNRQGYGTDSAITIYQANTTSGRIGFGGSPDTTTTNTARVKVTGNLQVTGTLKMLDGGEATITSSRTNSINTFAFNGYLTTDRTQFNNDAQLVRKKYVDDSISNALPVVTNLVTTNSEQTISSKKTFTGNIISNYVGVGEGTSPDVGRANLRQGASDRAGYVEIRKADNTRLGYLGYNNSQLTLKCEGTNTNLRVEGGIECTGNITAFVSDERLKDFISTIPNALDKVISLNGYYYKNNEKAKNLGYVDDKIQIGINAQEIEKVLPELVTLAPIDLDYTEEGIEVSKSGENIKTVYYDRLIPVLIEAIKELNNKVKELESKLNN